VNSKAAVQMVGTQVRVSREGDVEERSAQTLPRMEKAGNKKGVTKKSHIHQNSKKKDYGDVQREKPGLQTQRSQMKTGRELWKDRANPCRRRETA